MEIYDFKEFQKKVARFSISPYAEAITTLAGLSPQVISQASRLAASYASLRGTVQLLTTDEDNKIVDDTTESRETIARSAIVSTWVSIGPAVERLISLRKTLSTNGVTKAMSQYPFQYSSAGSTNAAGVITPTLYPYSGQEELSRGQFRVIIPKSWAQARTIDDNKKVLPLQLSPVTPVLAGLFTTNASKDEAYSEKRVSAISSQSFLVDGQPVAGAFAIIDHTQPRDVKIAELVFYRFETIANGIYLVGYKYPTAVPFTPNTGNYDTCEYFIGVYGDFTPVQIPASEMATSYGYALTSIRNMADGLVRISFPSAGTENVEFDPLDPREVFAQAYDAASAVLSLLEAMGYQSGLSSDDKELLTR